MTKTPQRKSRRLKWGDDLIIYEDGSVRIEMHFAVLRADTAYTAYAYKCYMSWSNGEVCDSIFADNATSVKWVCQRAFVKPGGLEVNFVCGDCAKGEHEKCPGMTHCDCQHRQPPSLPTNG